MTVHKGRKSGMAGRITFHALARMMLYGNGREFNLG